MPLELTIADKPLDLEKTKIVIKDKNVAKIKLSVRKTLDGNLIVQDHHSMNIVIVPDKGKIVSFPKDEYSQDCYADQNDLFKFLVKGGVIKPESVNGSNLYGSMEALYNIEKEGDEEPIEVVMLNIHKFLFNAKEDHKVRKKYIDDLEKNLLHPEEEHSTEMGEIPHSKYKGSIPVYGFPTRGVYRYNY